MLQRQHAFVAARCNESDLRQDAPLGNLPEGIKPHGIPQQRSFSLWGETQSRHVVLLLAINVIAVEIASLQQSEAHSWAADLAHQIAPTA